MKNHPLMAAATIPPITKVPLIRWLIRVLLTLLEDRPLHKPREMAAAMSVLSQVGGALHRVAASLQRPQRGRCSLGRAASLAPHPVSWVWGTVPARIAEVRLAMPQALPH